MLAGTPDKYGYRQVVIDGRPYKAHRVAWFIVWGGWPKAQIDHINGIRNDNRLTNLREATPTENNRNVRRRRNNSSGVAGVWFEARSGKWVAVIKIAGRVTRLGSFRDLDEAAAARKAAEQHYFGEFARAA